MSNIIGGSSGLTKLGTGTLTLTATNTYAGPTLVSSGTLLVNGVLAGGNVTNVATLGGTGTIGGLVQFNSGSFAQLKLGSPLKVNNALVIATGGTVPVVSVMASNNVPIGSYTLATYNNTGSSGSFAATPLFASGTNAPGTYANITTGGGLVQLVVAQTLAPGFAGRQTQSPAGRRHFARGHGCDWRHLQAVGRHQSGADPLDEPRGVAAKRRHHHESVHQQRPDGDQFPVAVLFLHRSLKQQQTHVKKWRNNYGSI